MPQRRLTRRQVVGMRTHCLTARGARWEDELRAERENAARSAGAPPRRVQQFAEAGLKIVTDTAGMLGRGGEQVELLQPLQPLQL